MAARMVVYNFLKYQIVGANSGININAIKKYYEFFLKISTFHLLFQKYFIILQSEK